MWWEQIGKTVMIMPAVNFLKYVYERYIMKIKHCTPQLTVDLVTFTEEILNGKLHFLCSDISRVYYFLIVKLLSKLKAHTSRFADQIWLNIYLKTF